MRSLQDARQAWDTLKQFQTIDELRQAARHGDHEPNTSTGLRSAIWKGLLLFDSVKTESWPKAASSSRSAYDALREHFLPSDSGSEVQDEEDSNLRSDIQQDVDRCMPDNLYFRTPETQRMLFDILFVYCKMNPDIGYRQGMHELAAPVLFVVERDAVDVGQSSKVMGEDAVVRLIFDADYVEHDAFALFSQIMQSAKVFYEQGTQSGAHENPIVMRSQRIFNELLPIVDRELAHHLQRVEIVPQIFLLRWIRLLFGREFVFDHVLAMWDVIFAEDPSLELSDHIALVMLLRIRWQLLAADYNTSLSLLLRYPAPEKDFAPRAFISDALYLRQHMDFESSSYIVLKYTGQAMQPMERPHTPPALPRNVTAFSGANTLPAALRRKNIPGRERSANNLENILQSTAVNLYNRGEKLGIGKAVRSAVDEVHRKALEIRSAPSVAGTASPTRVMHDSRVEAFEQRNKRLAELLSGAVTDLWEYQKGVSEKKGETSEATDAEQLENLSIAIAKVQFVQVYLSDGSLPLELDTTDTESKQESVNRTAESSMDNRTQPETEQTGRPRDQEQTKTTDTLANEIHPSTPEARQEVRPSIAESQYSWMLGQEEDASRDSPPRAFLATPDRPTSKSGFLFGSEQQQDSPGSTAKRKARPKKAAATSTTTNDIF